MDLAACVLVSFVCPGGRSVLLDYWILDLLELAASLERVHFVEGVGIGSFGLLINFVACQLLEELLGLVLLLGLFSCLCRI